MIEEAYISFETAKLLKEKGFNEECFALYNPDGVLIQSGIRLNNIQVGRVKGSYSAPTQQMAMRWLREIHNIHIVPMIENNGNYIGYLYDTKGNNVQGWDRRLSKTSYEQATEATIQYTLKNLI